MLYAEYKIIQIICNILSRSQLLWKLVTELQQEGCYVRNNLIFTCSWEINLIRKKPAGVMKSPFWIKNLPFILPKVIQKLVQFNKRFFYDFLCFEFENIKMMSSERFHIKIRKIIKISQRLLKIKIRNVGL